VTDQEWTIAKHRWDLLTKEVLGEEFVKKSYLHNRNISWVPFNKDYYPHSRSGMGRYRTNTSSYFANRYINGYEIQNI